MRNDAELVLGVQVDACSYDSVTAMIDQWARARESRYVCIANTHVVTTGMRDESYRHLLNGADLVTPDGMPVAWALRRLGHRGQQRVDGPGWVLHWCAHAEREALSVFLYGSTEQSLDLLRKRLASQFPDLPIAGTFSPPFRPLTGLERDDIVSMINDSGAGVVLVGLGAPKQERWMANMRGEVRAVMVGVGAAFDFHAGLVQRAPEWMQRSGLEWVHRLACDPRRLWRRYLIGNTLFVVGFARQLLRRYRRPTR